MNTRRHVRRHLLDPNRRVYLPVGPVAPLLHGFAASLPFLTVERNGAGWQASYRLPFHDGRGVSHGGAVVLLGSTASRARLDALQQSRRAGPFLIPLLTTILATDGIVGRFRLGQVADLLYPLTDTEKPSEQTRQQCRAIVGRWLDLLETCNLYLEVPTSKEIRKFEGRPITVEHTGTGYTVRLNPELRELLCQYRRAIPAEFLMLGSLAERTRKISSGGKRPTAADLLAIRCAALRWASMRAAQKPWRSRELAVRELLTHAHIDVAAIDQGRRWAGWTADVVAELQAAGMLRELPSSTGRNGATIVRVLLPRRRGQTESEA